MTDAGPPRILVVLHSRSGSTRRLCDAFVAGLRLGCDTAELRVRAAFDADVEDVRWAGAVALATPANFGYMSGALKDFFERIYHPCLGSTAGLPYVLLVKGDTDADGAVASVERIVTGMAWKRVLPNLVVVGPLEDTHLEQAGELGATLSAGLDAGIF